MIDWKAILNHSRVEFIETGANVNKGWIAVRCPFCGVSDTSQHMTIALNGKGWKCWRNPTHRGRDPVRLLSGLLHMGPDQVRALLGPEFVTLPDDLAASVRAKYASRRVDDLGPVKQPELREVLSLPEEFKWLDSGPAAKRYVEYLENRGFLRSNIFRFSERYRLRFAVAGPFFGRIIFPLYDGPSLIGWTGRSIYPSEKLRYKSHGSLQQLLWYDELRQSKAKVIVLCEGPFDALKVRELGRCYGIVATCFFTSAPTEGQIDRLYTLLPRFKERLLILDREATQASLQVAKSLTQLDIKVRWLPAGVKDPGELNMPGLISLVAQ
jgi:hypothetical protein